MGSGASKRISCPVCTETGFTNEQFVKHFQKTHSKQCTKCGLSGFETDQDMHQHYDEVHNPGSNQISCRKCLQRFVAEDEFIKHMKNEHNFSFNFSQLTLNDADRDTQCPECGKRKKNLEKLRKHLKKNHEFHCFKCGNKKESFKTLKELQKHYAEEHLQSFECPMNCSSAFSNVDTFLQHLLDEHKFAFVAGGTSCARDSTNSIQEINCPQCKVNVAISGLVSHIEKLHVSQNDESSLQLSEKGKQFGCPKCDGKIFKLSEELLNHMRTEHHFASNTELQNPKQNGRATSEENMKLPKVGDRVLAMWEVSMWQYFHARIRQKIEGTLRYEIDWDDGDTTGKLKNQIALFSFYPVDSLVIVKV